MKLEHEDDYRDDDYQETDERDEFGSRSIFAAGWFRAALVLITLAIVLVVSLPYLLNWFEPVPRPKVAKPEVSKPDTVKTPLDGAKMADGVKTTDATKPNESPEIKQTPPPAPSVSAPPTSQRPSTPPAAAKPAAPSVTASRATPPEPPATAATRSRTDKTGVAAKVEDRPAVRTKADISGSAGTAETSERYWVQLGAFRDGANAEALAKNLRSQGFAVQVSPVNRGTTDGQGRAQRHELFVAQARAEKVGAALKGRGRAESAPGGVIVKPAFSLDDAMTVSRQLTADGFNVVIRPAAAGAGNMVHVVRAGGYSDRARAVAARDALKSKGHDGFVAEGPAR